jgi:hypothetical protein
VEDSLWEETGVPGVPTTFSRTLTDSFYIHVMSLHRVEPTISEMKTLAMTIASTKPLYNILDSSINFVETVFHRGQVTEKIYVFHRVKLKALFLHSIPAYCINS